MNKLVAGILFLNASLFATCQEHFETLFERYYEAKGLMHTQADRAKIELQVAIDAGLQIVAQCSFETPAQDQMALDYLLASELLLQEIEQEQEIE